MALPKKTLLFILLIFGCSPERPSKTDPPVLTYLALGDSYTIGESVPEAQRWPVKLADSLRERDILIADPQIIATTGWTTSELQEGIINAETHPPYDLVSLLIGVNNQYRGYDINIYRQEFEELITQAIEFAGSDASKVFVVSIPNYGVTPFGITRGKERIRAELLKYDAIADSIASKYGISFVNITPISEGAKTDPELNAPDQLHPSGKQYSLWVSEMLPVVHALLTEQ